MRIKEQVVEIEFPRLRVGVLSDSQLNFSRRKTRSVFESNLLSAFRTMKRLGVNFVVFAGDICNTASKAGYRKFVRCLAEGYDGAVPHTLLIMGNHDYYLRAGSRESKRRLFERETGQSPYVHCIVNGYRFIGASPDCGSMRKGYGKVLPWLKRQIAVAESDGTAKPYFVITHNSPRNTVYGSAEWGDESLEGVFDGHPRLVNFAGHTHYSPFDDRIIWRGGFTAAGTGSVSYTELEKGKINGSVPPDAHTAPVGWVLDFDGDKVRLSLYNMKNGRREKECGILSTNAAVGASKRADTIPVMPASEGVWRGKNGTAEIEFDGAKGAHSYILKYSDGSAQEYFSDFWKGGDADARQKLTLYDKSAGTYEIAVYAVDSYGKTSDNRTIIKNVEIKRKRRYRRRLAPDVRY